MKFTAHHLEEFDLLNLFPEDINIPNYQDLQLPHIVTIANLIF